MVLSMPARLQISDVNLPVLRDGWRILEFLLDRHNNSLHVLRKIQETNIYVKYILRLTVELFLVNLIAIVICYDMYTSTMRRAGVIPNFSLDCTFGLAARDENKFSTYF